MTLELLKRTTKGVGRNSAKKYEKLRAGMIKAMQRQLRPYQTQGKRVPKWNSIAAFMLNKGILPKSVLKIIL